MGNESGVVESHAPHFSSLIWLCVVSFSCPPFQCTTSSMWACRWLAVSRIISIKPDYVAFRWAWHNQPVIMHTGRLIARAWRWACLPWCVTFDPPTFFLGRGGRSKVRQCQLTRQTTAVEFTVRRGERKAASGVIVWRMYCHAHTGNEVSCGLGGFVQWPI